ncbi:MAG: sodium:proton antiporter [Methylomonas sp.]|nr:sodium:proton antiporter [Methylomonas sp.]PPD21977.1 MAG: sodium:proton exchanger [Methylomonas sp.]PPD25554.1 MAG: sodium:proton exchanger [Methylomonas sp.]PPD36464.1 MAG: sodium:proton exchanger [Methylomonas sp.]PPD39513.1 MAG: sodium:proton exchanger [Methylomonas sp.]
MNLDVFLSLFSLMLISLAVFVTSKKIGVPYTVLLVIVGSLLIPLSHIEFFSFITSFKLTPELLFFVFLPVLIFESAYNMNIRSVTENIYSIGSLAIIGLLVSTLFIGIGGFYIFDAAGFAVPMLVLLLFGAIISSTDPVAVLALFKEYGAPQRLTLIFEGESLFNDATGFAAFLVILDLITHGYHGYASLFDALMSFSIMLGGGIVFGLFMGFIFARLIELVRGNEHLEITLTLLVAHLTFVLTEVISEHLVIAGHEIRLSSIIATLIASMVIGNFGRYKMSPDIEEYMEKFWSYFAFVTNSLVFILMGLLFADLAIDLNIALLPILLAVATVVVGRALAVYPVLWLLNKTGKERAIPRNWMHLLAWGSLRGSLAVIMVLLIPDDLTVPNWSFSFSVKDFVTAVTIGSIYFTLLVKATTIGKVMHALGIDALTDMEQVGYFKSKAQMYEKSLEKLQDLANDQQITQQQYDTLKQQHENLYQIACLECKQAIGKSPKLTENMLRTYALGVEKEHLKEIFLHGEIEEKTYKKITNMLSIQTERIKRGHEQVKSVDEHFPIDSLEQFVLSISRIAFWRDHRFKAEELYRYYRALNKISGNVVKELSALEQSGLSGVFDDSQALAKIITLYQAFQVNTHGKMLAVIKQNEAMLNALNEAAATQAIAVLQGETLDKLYKNEIITSKLYIMLRNEMGSESQRK